MYFQKGVFIMNEKVLKTLEYNKITEKLEGYAATDMARRMCHELQPMTDITSIEAALSNTNDALGRSIAHSAPSFGGFTLISVRYLKPQPELHLMQATKKNLIPSRHSLKHLIRLHHWQRNLRGVY